MPDYISNDVISDEIYIAFMRKGRRKFMSVKGLYIDDVSIDCPDDIYTIKFNGRLSDVRRKVLDYMSLMIDLEVSLGHERENCLLHYTPVKVIKGRNNEMSIIDVFELGL